MSKILQFVQGVVTNSGKPNFSLFQQQDAAELLSCIFEEFSIESLREQNILMYKLRNKVACNTCFNHSCIEEFSLLDSIQTALNS